MASVAGTYKIFAHRFKWSHENLRRQMRRALKSGRAKLIEVTKDGWLYEVPSDFKVGKAPKGKRTLT